MADIQTDAAAEMETLEDFRVRVRQWLKDNVPLAGPPKPGRRGQASDEEELVDVARNRVLQKQLFDAGLAGIAFPKEYGGAGLTPAHNDVMNEEVVGYEFPDRIQVPTFTPCASIILEFGTEEQKRNHLPKILSGEEIWMQMLSEPGGGSDVASAVTTATPDGDDWIVNGSKIWTTGAWWADWALILTRSNWDVPKHRGLTVFMVKIHQPNIEINRIEMLDGAKEFCQEFLTDVVIPDTDRIGDIDGGWVVGSRWMVHEKSISISPYVTRPGKVYPSADASGPTNVGLARRAGKLQDPVVRQLIGEAHALKLAGDEGGRRVGAAIAGRHYTEQAAGIGRILSGVVQTELATLSFKIAGATAVAWEEEDEPLGEQGVGYLVRQSGQIGGGTTEMSRNVVSERFLGMPPEARNDRDKAFRDIPRGPETRSR